MRVKSSFVNEGNEEAFEQKFLQRNKHLENVPGFRALRFLRPKTVGRHYIIVTLWEDRQAFYDWQNSAEYAETHKKRGTSKVWIIALLIAIYHIMLELNLKNFIII